jgi:hypothetical protein
MAVAMQTVSGCQNIGDDAALEVRHGSAGCRDDWNFRQAQATGPP